MLCNLAENGEHGRNIARDIQKKERTKTRAVVDILGAIERREKKNSQSKKKGKTNDETKDGGSETD